MQELTRLNKLLKDHFGQTIDGKGKFRLAWSEDLHEHRRGNYVDFVPGTNILLRDVVETRWTRKYTAIKDKYILESWVYENDQSAMVASGNGHYEYRQVFKADANGKPILPPWNVLKFLCNLLTSGVKSTVSDMKDMDRQEREAFINEATDILSNEVPFLAGKLANGTAVVNPGVN